MATLLQDLVSKAAREHPSQLMVQDGPDVATYGEMEAFTNRFARHLVTRGVRRQQPVAFLMDKSTNAFRAFISILKADAIYVPLNVRTPDERNQYILHHAKCQFLVCDAKSLAKASQLVEMLAGHVETITIDEDSAFAGKPIPAQARLYSNVDADLAYLMYTSGSTGTPKGVMISHRNVIDYAEWTVEYFKVTRDDRLSSHPGLHFDLSIFDVYTAFKSGASLHLVPPSSSMFPIKIVEFIENNHLTLWNSVPSLLTFIAKSGVLSKGCCPSLKTVTFNGEVMPTQTLMEWMRACPHVRFVNQYGPTETSCASMYYEIKAIPVDASKPIPIGTAIPNTEVLVLAKDGTQAKIGEIGELHIRGAGNGQGYLYDDEKTSQSFIRNPLSGRLTDRIYATGDLARLREDGNHEFCGRRDHQIKFMGHRVELGEIEATLDSFDYVAASTAISIDHQGLGGAIIVAYVVPRKTIDTMTVKNDLARKLPRYMVPREVIVIGEMPLNANGKTDRVALADRYREKRKKREG